MYYLVQFVLVNVIGLLQKGVHLFQRMRKRMTLHKLYKDTAIRASQESYAQRKKVGAVIVTPSGITSVGWNKMPIGYPLVCELEDGTTDPLVTHAEMDALYNLSKQGISTTGAVIYTTMAPCLNCAKALVGSGITTIYYRDTHREDALEYLHTMKIKLEKWR